jgi:hypothetical protein
VKGHFIVRTPPEGFVAHEPVSDKAGFLAALHALPQPDHDAIAARPRQHT